jgi:hypothetical protein
LGTEFWAGYGFISSMKVAAGSLDLNYGLSLFVSSPKKLATIVVDIPALPLSQRSSLGYPKYVTIPADSIVEIKDFPVGDLNSPYNAAGLADSRLYYTGVCQRGINIKSSNGVPISIVEHLWADNNSAASTLLSPVNYCGSKYIIETSNGKSNVQSNNSYFFIIANQDSTNVNIVPKGDIIDSSSQSIFTSTQGVSAIKYKKGQPFNIVLNKGEVFNAMSIIDATTSISSDLSGTVIQSLDSTKKIAVFGGSGRVTIDTSASNSVSTGSDHLIQQLLPISLWGYKYLTTPTKTMEYNYFRIYVKDTLANVFINGSVLNKNKLLNKSFHYFLFE